MSKIYSIIENYTLTPAISPASSFDEELSQIEPYLAEIKKIWADKEKDPPRDSAKDSALILPSCFQAIKLSPWLCVAANEEMWPDSSNVTGTENMGKATELHFRPASRLLGFESSTTKIPKESEQQQQQQCETAAMRAVASMLVPPNSLTVTSDDIAGLDEVKKLIRERIINPIRRPDLHRGLYKAPKGILLFGPPGTGKTLIAKWIAAASGAQFFDVSPSRLLSKFYGETESAIQELFLQAQARSPCIIFVDEVDSLLGQRRSNDDDTAIRTKNQFLQSLDGIRTSDANTVVFIGATNRPEALDEAALRRLTKRVLVPLPDAESRAAQLCRLLHNHKSRSGFTADESAEPLSPEETGLSLMRNNPSFKGLVESLSGWNGSDIKALCEAAAEFPYDEAIETFGSIDHVPGPEAFRDVTVTDLERALKRVRPMGHSATVKEYEAWEAAFGCK